MEARGQRQGQRAERRAGAPSRWSSSARVRCSASSGSTRTATAASPWPNVVRCVSSSARSARGAARASVRTKHLPSGAGKERVPKGSLLFFGF
jgi:hypothetical protein